MNIDALIDKKALPFLPVLLILGNILKSFEFIPDEFIPVIIIISSIIITGIYLGFTKQSILQGIFLGASAIGMHQVPKQIMQFI